MRHSPAVKHTATLCGIWHYNVALLLRIIHSECGFYWYSHTCILLISILHTALLKTFVDQLQWLGHLSHIPTCIFLNLPETCQVGCCDAPGPEVLHIALGWNVCWNHIEIIETDLNRSNLRSKCVDETDETWAYMILVEASSRHIPSWQHRCYQGLGLPIASTPLGQLQQQLGPTWPNPANSEGDVKVRTVIYRFLPVINWSFRITWCGLVLCLCGFVQLVPSQAWEVALLVPIAFLAILRLGSEFYQTEQHDSSDIKWYQVISSDIRWWFKLAKAGELENPCALASAFEDFVHW